MKDIGSVDEPLKFVGEELQVDVFDGADPTDVGTRHWWYRGDLSVNGSDAVIRVNNNGEIVDVPVYGNSTSVEAGIDTRFGVVAPGLSEPAFVPLTDPADAAFDFGRIETPSGTELSLHNRTAPGSAIPDSVLYQWRVEEFASPWPANVGPVDMTVAGLTASTFSNGENSVSGDGTDSYGEADGPQSLPSNQSFGAALTSQASSDAYIWGVSDSGANSNAFRLRYINGSINVEISDSAGSILEVQTDSTFTDGTPHAIVINKSGNSASDIDIYVDDMATPAATTTNDDQAFDHSNYSQTGQLAFWGRNNDADSGTAPLSLLAGDHGVFEFWDSPLDQSDRDGFVSRRPEV